MTFSLITGRSSVLPVSGRSAMKRRIYRTIKEAMLSLPIIHSRACRQWWTAVVTVTTPWCTVGALALEVLSQLARIHFILLQLSLSLGWPRRLRRGYLFWLEVWIGHAYLILGSGSSSANRGISMYRVGR